MNENNPGRQKAAALSPADWEQTARRAADLMAGQKFGCSESLMLAFQERLGPETLPTAAVAMSSAFRGGLGSGCLCGALAAAEMVLGALFGYHGQADGDQNPEAVKQARLLYQEVHDRFRASNKAACCRILTKNMAQGSQERKDNCARLVQEAARLTGDIIARESRG